MKLERGELAYKTCSKEEQTLCHATKAFITVSRQSRMSKSIFIFK